MSTFVYAFTFLCSIISLPLSIIAIIKVMSMEKSTHNIYWKNVEGAEMSDEDLNKTLEKDFEKEALRKELEPDEERVVA